MEEETQGTASSDYLNSMTYQTVESPKSHAAGKRAR